MVARFVRDEEAAGSNPVTPTHVRGPAFQHSQQSLHTRICCRARPVGRLSAWLLGSQAPWQTIRCGGAPTAPRSPAAGTSVTAAGPGRRLRRVSATSRIPDRTRTLDHHTRTTKGSDGHDRTASRTEALIETLLPHLEAGDILVDGGKAHFPETRRREAELRATRSSPTSWTGVCLRGEVSPPRLR